MLVSEPEKNVEVRIKNTKQRIRIMTIAAI
jgi:hypothetical protein